MNKCFSPNTAASRGRQHYCDLMLYPHYREPDYTRLPAGISPGVRTALLGRLTFLYGEAAARQWLGELERILKVYQAYKPPELIDLEGRLDRRERFTEKDLVLITYGDMVKADGATPLEMLLNVVNAHNLGAVNTLHLLPFFPYSSDRGFAVVDFTRVDPRLGTWDDILRMGLRYNLMFDGVFNHCSSKSRMFREFLNGNPYYKHFFIAYRSPGDLTPDQRSKIFRPRTSDILTRFDTIEGPRWVWTTFSADQVDLNFRNPAVLMRVIEGLLFYATQGADIIRLDAVTYIWAEPGTECVHLPQTHEIVKLIRTVLDAVAPGVAILTETNVPHRDNVAYFGDGRDEAHMVYNFALPPLVLHSLYAGDATALSRWAAGMRNPSDAATFFNILDTHDGIGLMGVRGILGQQDIDRLIATARGNGAYISYKMTPELTEEPYEINATWWSAVNGEGSSEDTALQVRRYLAGRSIQFSLQGVPGVYLHGVIGTENAHDLVRLTGCRRDVNRAAVDVPALAARLRDPASKLSLLSPPRRTMTLARTRQRAFHPQGAQQVLMLDPRVFAVLRTSPEGDEQVLALTNVSSRQVSVGVPPGSMHMPPGAWRDLLSDAEYEPARGGLRIELGPYQACWLKPASQL